MRAGRRVLIVGCGYVGSRVGVMLSSSGHAVWGLRRRINHLPPTIRGVQADLMDADSLTDLPSTLDALVYCVSAGGKGDAARYRAVYAESLERILSLYEKRRDSPRRLLFVSSTGVYGQSSGEWVDETSPAEPSTVSGQCMLEAEQVAAAREASVIVRLSGIYGPGRTRLVRALREGRAACVRGRPRYLNQIHRDDCAGALAHLLSLPDPARLYIATDMEPATRRTVWDWMAATPGMPAPREIEPDDPSATQDRRGNKRCRNRRLIDSGYRFVYPTFRDGYADLLGA